MCETSPEELARAVRSRGPGAYLNNWHGSQAMKITKFKTAITNLFTFETAAITILLALVSLACVMFG